MTIKRLAVYCGSAPGTDPAFADMARALIVEMAGRGIDLHYLGNTFPNPSWGVRYALSVLTRPFTVARPNFAPPDAGEAGTFLHRPALEHGSVVLRREAWWVRSADLAQTWLDGTPAERLLAARRDCERYGMPPCLYAQAHIPPQRSSLVTQDLLDANRKPAEVLAWLGLERGDRVLDYFTGGGYWTEIIARAVGPEGRVTGWNPPAAAGNERIAAALAAIHERSPNTEFVSSPVGLVAGGHYLGSWMPALFPARPSKPRVGWDAPKERPAGWREPVTHFVSSMRNMGVIQIRRDPDGRPRLQLELWDLREKRLALDHYSPRHCQFRT